MALSFAAAAPLSFAGPAPVARAMASVQMSAIDDLKSLAKEQNPVRREPAEAVFWPRSRGSA